MRLSIRQFAAMVATIVATSGVLSAAQPPRPAARSDIEAMLSRMPVPPAEDELRQLDIVLLAGPKDHGPNEHDYPLWQKRWKVLLGGSGPDDEPRVNLFGPPRPDNDGKMLAGADHVNVTTAWQWPSREQLANADLIVMHCAPQWSAERLDDLKNFLGRGGGFVVVHMSLWQNSPQLAELIGLAKQEGTQFRHGPVNLELTAPDHPICAGLPRRIALLDESYFGFQGDAGRISVLATSRELLPGAGEATPEPMFWTLEQGPGRVFVCVAGHYDWSFDDPMLRLLLLRGMAWAAQESPYRFDPLVLRGAAVSDTATPAAAKVAPVAPEADDPDLLLWLDAADEATVRHDQAGRVSAWANKARRVGRQLQSEGEQRPVLVADGLGSQPALRFDGVDDALRDTGFGRSATTWTVIMVVAPQSNREVPFRAFFASNQTAMLDYTTGLNIDQGGGPTAEFSVLNVEGIKDAPGATNLRSESSPFGEGQILAVRTDEQETQLFFNGAPEGSRPASDAVTSFEQVRVGARYYLDRERGYLHGDIAEVLVYQSALDDQRLAAICAHLAEKYGLAIVGPVHYSLEDALGALPFYDGLSDRRIFKPIDEAIAAPFADADARLQLETQLLAVLQSDATRAAKDLICRKLARIGTGRSVPALAALLVEPELSHMARWALDQIGDPAGSAALRGVLLGSGGLTQAGIIASLGARRDRDALPGLASLLVDADPIVVAAAIDALGKIGSPEAANALGLFAKQCPVSLQSALARARLQAAWRLASEGHAAEANAIYRDLESHGERAIRLAAFQGLAATDAEGSLERLIAALGSDDAGLRGVAANLIRERRDTDTTGASAAAMAHLPPAGQVALLQALTGREDAAARKTALAGLDSPQTDVRLAAYSVLIASGSAEDVPRLAGLAAHGETESERNAAFVAISRLDCPGVDATIWKHLAAAEPDVRVCLVRSLVARDVRRETAPLIALAEQDSQAAVRIEAINALQVLAGGDNADALVQLLLTRPPGEEQSAAQRAVVAACSRIDDPQQRAAPLLSAFEKSDQTGRCKLLAALGSVGGQEVLRLVHTAMDDADGEVRDAGIAALASWPDATVARELLDMARQTTDDRYRVWALRGLARVVPRPGPLPRQEAFEMLREAMAIAEQPEEKRLLITRMEPIRVADCLAFVLSQIGDPDTRSEAVAAAASLAEGMKESHPQEARTAMEKLLQQQLDPVLRKRLEALISKLDSPKN